MTLTIAFNATHGTIFPSSSSLRRRATVPSRSSSISSTASTLVEDSTITSTAPPKATSSSRSSSTRSAFKLPSRPRNVTAAAAVMPLVLMLGTELFTPQEKSKKESARRTTSTTSSSSSSPSLPKITITTKDSRTATMTLNEKSEFELR